jgi:hypothetical protein
MRYVMMICADEATAEATAAEASDAGMAEVYAWFEKWAGAGKVADGGAELQSVKTARTIRGAGSGRTVTDGPFIETKEALGGYYVIEARDLDQALELAKVCPSGNVEVRPIMDTSSDAEPPA